MEENQVIVGKKHVMNYVTALMTMAKDGKKEIIVSARGRNISKAVDVVEIARRKFLEGLKIKKIEIGTDEINGRRKSRIDIILNL